MLKGHHSRFLQGKNFTSITRSRDNAEHNWEETDDLEKDKQDAGLLRTPRRK